MVEFWISWNLLNNDGVLTSKWYGIVPLVTVFTKFDGQIVAEYIRLKNVENIEDWEKARDNAEITFQRVYLPKVLNTDHPPKAHVRLEGENNKYFCSQNCHIWVDMDISSNNCPELTETTADAIDNVILQELFISTQRNNLDLCVKSALQWESHLKW